MARLQELHPDQQAVLRLLLGRRMRYAELADVLGLDSDRVRERALDAVDGLAPDDVEGLELEDRDRIADYLLGQQNDGERGATETLIATSAPAREWLGRLTPELSALSADALPIPDPQPSTGRAEAPPAPSPGITAAFAALDGPDGAPSSTPTWVPDGVRAAAASRTGRIVAAVIGTVVLVLIVLLAVGAFGGGDGEEGPTAETPTTTADEPSEAALATAVASALPQQVNLTPPSTASGAAAKAVAVGQTNINDNVPGLVFQAQNLPELPSDRVYSIWVVGGGKPDALLGRLDKIAETGEALVDKDGTVEPVFVPFATLDGSTTRVIDVRPYSKIRVTRDSASSTRPGTTVLSGSLKTSDAAD